MYYEAVMWDVIALCALCLLIGLLGGWLLATRTRKDRAPAPALPDYDPANPMNAGREPETVQAGGATWYVIRPKWGRE